MSDGQPNNPYTTQQTPDVHVLKILNQVHNTKDNTVDFFICKVHFTL